MRRLVSTLVGLSLAAAVATATAIGADAQADPKKQPPAVDKKQPPAPPEPKPAAAKHVMVAPGDLKWGPAPPGLPAGAEAAVLDGDPSKPGMFTIRAKLPDGFRVPPHSHPTDEHVTIISGSMMIGMGSKWDDAAMQTMGAGSYAKMPRRTNHYVQAKGETIIQISAIGPFAITYVNASDDPRKKKTE
jgi:quercetin dioxygenase-like cupin family protein